MTGDESIKVHWTNAGDEVRGTCELCNEWEKRPSSAQCV